MKITIDTQHDSFEDIKKVFHLLGGILERKGNGVVTTESGSPVDTSNLMSMFGNDSTTKKEMPDTAPDFSSFLNLTKGQQQKEPPEDTEKIEMY
ncbi:MAG: hypothetical protein AABX37_02255 [Nanoarchaeota archaeon]